MSQENVERFVESTEAMNRRDVPAALRFTHPEIRHEPQRAAMQGPYIGLEAVKEYYADSWETFEVFEVQYAEVHDLGDQVLGLGTVRTRGTGSGVETEVPIAIVATYEMGLMTHLKDFGDKNKALEAVGLRE